MNLVKIDDELEAIKSLVKYVFKKLKTRKIEKIFKHPEVENYGLNCDYDLWAEFNREMLVRNITKMERQTLYNMNMLSGVSMANIPLLDYCNVDMITDFERMYANARIITMIELGLINKYTFLNQENR